jgi:hypothetical protein
MDDFAAMVATLLVGATGIFLASKNLRVTGGASAELVLKNIDDIAQWQAEHPELIAPEGTVIDFMGRRYPVASEAHPYITRLNEMGFATLHCELGKQGVRAHALLAMPPAVASRLSQALQTKSDLFVHWGLQNSQLLHLKQPWGSVRAMAFPQHPMPVVNGNIEPDNVYDSEDDVYPSDDEWESEVALNPKVAVALPRSEYALVFIADLVWGRPTHLYDTISKLVELETEPPRQYYQSTCPICLDEIDCQAQPNRCRRLMCTRASKRVLPTVLEGVPVLEACSTADLLEELKNVEDEAVVVLACGHAIHTECLTGLIKNSKTNKCPSCHHVIVKGEITRGVDYMTNAQRIDQDAALAARLQEDETVGGTPNNIVRIRDIGALALWQAMHPELMTMEEPDEEGLVRPYISRLNMLGIVTTDDFAAGGNGCRAYAVLVMPESKAKKLSKSLGQMDGLFSQWGGHLELLKLGNRMIMELNPLPKEIFKNVLERINPSDGDTLDVSAIPRRDCTCVMAVDMVWGRPTHLFEKIIEIVQRKSAPSPGSHDSPPLRRSQTAGSNVQGIPSESERSEAFRHEPQQP